MIGNKKKPKKKEYEIWKKYKYNVIPTLIDKVKLKDPKEGDKIKVKRKGTFEIIEIDNIKQRIDVK